VNAADAPVSTTRDTLSESKGIADVEDVVEKAQRNACIALCRDCNNDIFRINEDDNKRGSLIEGMPEVLQRETKESEEK
jgi:hypothetical protein